MLSRQIFYTPNTHKNSVVFVIYRIYPIPTFFWKNKPRAHMHVRFWYRYLNCPIAVHLFLGNVSQVHHAIEGALEMGKYSISEVWKLKKN